MTLSEWVRMHGGMQVDMAAGLDMSDIIALKYYLQKHQMTLTDLLKVFAETCEKDS